MSKSTKKILIISGIIMVAWTLVIFFVCKANACDCPNYSFHACNNTSDKTGVNTYPILIYPEKWRQVSISDLAYHGNIEETNEAWRKIISNDIKIGDMVESNDYYHYLSPEKPKNIGRVVESLGYPSSDGYERVKLNDRTEWTTKYLHKIQDSKKPGKVEERTGELERKVECKCKCREDTLITKIFETNVGTLTSYILEHINEIERKVEALSEGHFGTLNTKDGEIYFPKPKEK